MAKFSNAEKQLLKRVTDDRLHTSLAMLREAAEKIWIDTPRIIQDYTDHSISHSGRLAGFAVKLLAANNGKPLSNEEMYLLLASIYLHDIGMQCDVVLFPEIKVLAETMGASFDNEISAQSANQYSIDEQKAIRKNHQYLSIAWIDYASRIGKTVLGPGAQTIPEELVDDLMDICKHHTKLAITDCPLAFTYDPTGRKQLVAAILRLSDELDIDGRRVNIEAVKTFSLNPSNSVYWWIHNRTKVVFRTQNQIDLTIRLHPADIKQYGLFVYKAFITEFQSKNRPVLNILVQNNIPISISDDSKVVEADRAERLPSEIVQALEAMQQKRNPLIDLALEVRTWLRAIRYEVSEPLQHNDRTVDMLATLDLGAVRQRVLVRCIGGEITSSEVESFDALLDRKTPQGWLISDMRVSSGARELASKDDAIQVFNLPTFLQQKVWGPYIDTLATLIRHDRIPDLYVGPGCYKLEKDKQGEETKNSYPGLEDYIDSWLKERGKMHISILGDFGSGKTWFCRHYAFRQMESYFKDPVHNRLPLLITLRSFAKAMTASQLINDALLEQYKLPFVGSAFETFQEMNRQGKLLLILDGFDEMARQVDYQTVVDNSWELANLVDEDSKVILTSRTEYFRWAEETERILSGKEFGRRTIVLRPPKFEVLYLEPFNDEQIRKVISLRMDSESGSAMADRILKAKNLAEMARKPVLIELLLAALDEVNADVLENSSKVYLYATNKLLLRNITAEKTFTSTSDKLYFLCELAWQMISSDNMRVHYKAIPEMIKAYFGDRIKDQHELDTWDYDLRSQTLLHRNVVGAGYYEFAHKSLAEYFVALKFAAELGCLPLEFTQTYSEANGQFCKIPFEQKNITFLAKSFGAIPLKNAKMHAVNQFLWEMITKDSLRELWQILYATRGKTLEQVNYTGGNVVGLLLYLGESFEKVNLVQTVLAAANLNNLNLSETDFTGCDLYNANLRGSRFAEHHLKDAKLQHVSLTLYYFKKQRVKKASGRGGPEIGISQKKRSSSLAMSLWDKITPIIENFGVQVFAGFGDDYADFITGGAEIIVNDLDFWPKMKEALLSELTQVALYDSEIDQLLIELPADLRDKVIEPFLATTALEY